MSSDVIGETVSAATSNSKPAAVAVETNGNSNPAAVAVETNGPSRISICRRVCLIIVAVGILVLLCLFIWAYIHDSSSPFDGPESPYTRKGNCLIIVRESDIYRFNELVNDKKYDSLFVKLKTSQVINKSTMSHIYEPENWIWARHNSPILDLPSSYPIWSFGILDIRTKRNVTLHLDLSPPGCEFEWGDEKTQTTVGKALVNFSLSERGSFKWCYSVRLRDVKNNPTLEKDFSFFVQDLGYKCCHNHHVDGTDQIVPKCPDDVMVQRIWTHLPFITAFLTLLVFPNILVFIYQFLSFKSHVYWTHHRHESDEDDDSSLDYESKTFEWVHTDYKSPVTFFSFLRSFPNCSFPNCSSEFCNDIAKHVLKSERNCNEIVKRLLKGLLTSIGMVILSLLMVIVPVIMYYISKDGRQMLQELIQNDVPIGFLSILFPYEDNHDNFMSLMKGPFVFFPVYAFLAIIYLTIHSYSNSREHAKNTYLDTGKFSLNLDLVEKYGRINISKHYRYGIFETFHANARAIQFCSFWKELMKRIWSFEKGKSEIWQCLFFLFASVFSGLVHFIPFFFGSILILSNLIQRIKCQEVTVCGCFILLLRFIISLALHCLLVYFFTIIYFGSAEFVSFVISFCVLAIIIFLSVAAGIFLYALIAMYYILKRFREVARKYASHRDVVISVSQSLNDKCKFAEARVEERRYGKCLLISGVNILLVKFIVIVHFRDQIQMNSSNGFHCHLEGKVLKILTPSILEGLAEIKISGVLVSIGATLPTEGKRIFEVDTRGKLKLHVVSTETFQSAADTVVTDEDESCFVKYRNGLPGIPRELLDRTIDEYMPVGAERFQAFLSVLVILGIWIWVIKIIIHFDKMEQMQVIIQALILVVLVRLSDVVRMFSIDVDDGHKRKIRESDLRLTVLEFWTEKRFRLNSDVHDATINIQETAT